MQMNEQIRVSTRKMQEMRQASVLRYHPPGAEST